MARGLSVSFNRGFLADFYVRSLPPEVRSHLLVLHMLDRAGELAGMPDDVVAAVCGCTVERLAEVLDVLDDKDLARRTGPGEWELPDYHMRKPRARGSSTRRNRSRRDRSVIRKMAEKGGESDNDCKSRDALKTAQCGSYCGTENGPDAGHIPGCVPASSSHSIPPAVPPTSNGARGSDHAQNVALGASNGDSASPPVGSVCHESDNDCKSRDALNCTPEPYVNVERNRLKNDNENENSHPAMERCGNTHQKIGLSFLPGADTTMPRQMIMPTGMEHPSVNDIVREQTALMERVPKEWRREGEMKTLRHLRLEYGFERVLWSIEYVRKQLESRRGNFWGYLRDACKKDYSKGMRLDAEAIARCSVAFERCETEQPEVPEVAIHSTSNAVASDEERLAVIAMCRQFSEKFGGS